MFRTLQLSSEALSAVSCLPMPRKVPFNPFGSPRPTLCASIKTSVADGLRRQLNPTAVITIVSKDIETAPELKRQLRPSLEEQTLSYPMEFLGKNNPALYCTNKLSLYMSLSFLDFHINFIR